MSHLLHILKPQSKTAKKGAVPLLMEFPVSPETAPYLVSSTKSVLWIEHTHPNDVVKAAVRTGTSDDVYKEILTAIRDRSRQDAWGSVHPLTPEGLRAAVEHVEYYEMGDVELLVPRRLSQKGDDMDDVVLSLVKDIGVSTKPSSWVPKGHILVVPKERSFVGVLATFDGGRLVAVVHNPARGIAVVCDG